MSVCPFRCQLLPVVALVALACGDDGTGPIDVVPTMELPREVAGVTLELSSFAGAELVDTTATWRASLAALGVSASALVLSAAVAPDTSNLTLQIVALSARGVDWGDRVDAYAEALVDEGIVDAQRRVVGGREVWRAHAPGDPSSAYYYAVGDVVFTIRTDDEDIAEEVLRPLGLPPSAVSEAPPPSAFRRPLPSAAGVITVSLLQPPRPPLCVAEPLGDQMLTLMTVVHTEVGPMADPFVSLFATSSHGEFAPVPTIGMHHSPRYAITRFGFGTPDDVALEAISLTGATGNGFYRFGVQHCMNGTWADGARTLRIRHMFDEVTATIETGTLVCGATGTAFSGTLRQDQPVASMSGADLKVCNPPDCVDAGFLEATALVPYEMTLSDDGMSADFEWTETLFDYEYDDQGELVGCNASGDTQTNSFSIDRITFGPERPS